MLNIPPIQVSEIIAYIGKSPGLLAEAGLTAEAMATKQARQARTMLVMFILLVG